VVSPNLFGLLRVKPLLGRLFTVDDDRLGAAPVVLLSHDLWSQQFGSDPAMIGKAVKLSDTQYGVIGVMPAGFNHEAGSQFWLPVAFYASRLIRGMLYGGVSATDPSVYAMVALAVGAVSLVAAWAPARRRRGWTR
jgi:hypothetical protein